MCLAVPSKVISISDVMATIEVHGARKDVSLLLMPEPVQTGDYVLVHAGFAIQKVDGQAAEEALEMLNVIVRQMESEESGDH